MRFRAAVLHEVNAPLQVQDVEMAALRPGDVLVRLQASGLCHTDLEVIQGSLAYPLPICWGTKAPASSRRSAAMCSRSSQAIT